MTKRLLLFVLVCLCFLGISQVHAEDVMEITRKAGYTVSEVNKPKASIVVDAKTSEILWQDNIDMPRDPASMSKMFTLYILFEELAKGKITLDTTITATETDQAISKIYEISNNNIVAGVAYPIRDLIIMTVVPSSNAATVMIANYLSNNDASAFIDRINKTAKELGMTNTHFSNASGAIAQAFQGYYVPEKYDLTASNITTARDFATLIYYFLNNYPSILDFTNQTVVRTMVGTPYEEEFHSYNHSLPDGKFGIEGVDGMKTGSSPSAAFNAVVTAKRGNTRLITVVLGVGDWSDQNGEFYRHPFINALTEKAFKDSKTLTKAKRSKLKRLVAKPASTAAAAKKQLPQATTDQSFLEKIEQFVDDHRPLVLICLAIFILIVLLLALMAFMMGR
ncbi:TPA: D-alanyl-D-alanine carboxypeptidase [Streptococcus equi subsp. zooepidemicus]|uniref:D-alanyl-D-alanine carboxypeptidase family protein n=1 Tax=Streptococcus equi TaxID=1336 RepID=UPI0013F656DE|nr:serine hydrolase [Streptococcus equi]MCD3385450.1 serine hydrolase [Streptococcus equi subsp. zooepidemicus]MCD3387823.1 serine hydrolase [Streptococcus equi subsp. zooepidemicus]MCD3393857.1 serine hydrolase [Streptococcus equi subsp. zooepidemicus]MCD3415513.1 serine hydrolase [Streptococcus equi subsp. zooepidemicus]MCD3416817.1 serine hydrolase [Streptococcus equi subsp. zooepidemicus]